MGMWVGLGLCIMVMLTSCDNFFGTSWGKPREYDLGKINLTQGNLQHFTEAATGNPKLAEALAKKIIEELPNKTGKERADFQEAGIKLAVEQAEVGTKIIELAGDVLDDFDNEDLKDLLVKVLKTADSDVAAAAKNIATIVEGDLEPGAHKFKGESSYGQNAKPSDVGMAIMVLSLGILAKEGKDFDDVQDKDMNDWFNNLEINGKNVVFKNQDPNTTAKSKALAAYLNLIANDRTGKFSGNPITGAVQDVFNI
jgi:DNA-binding protein YbaB